MVDIVTSVSLWELVKHAMTWVVNLKRASNDRKLQSVDALRKVIIAAQRTSVYLRQIKDTGIKSHQMEAELSVLWTELSFKLEDLGIESLAKRCRIKGKHWTNPDAMDGNELEKSDVGLEKMEQLANEILRDVHG